MNSNHRPRIWPFDSRLKVRGCPSGLRKEGLEAIKLGTPIGRVLRENARSKFETTSFQRVWVSVIILALSGLPIPGRVVNCFIHGLKKASTCHDGPNQRNKSSRIGNKITYGLFATVLNPARSAWRIRGFSSCLSELVFIQTIILPHPKLKGYD